MLTDEQQVVPVDGLTCRDVVVLLQCIHRLTKTGVLRDNELSVVGSTRGALVESMEKAIGINFDQARAIQEEELRRQQEQSQSQEVDNANDAKVAGATG